jgi:hypothetical protein
MSSHAPFAGLIYPDKTQFVNLPGQNSFLISSEIVHDESKSVETISSTATIARLAN